MGTQLTTVQARETVPFINTKRGLIAVRSAYPEFKDCPEAERSNRLYIDIQYAAAMDGQDIPKESLVIVAKEVGITIQGTPASHLTYPEIHTAIRNGASGQYGDWYRLNVRTVVSWLNSFIEENKNTYREIQRMKDKERIANSGDFYLEKVRHNMERVIRERAEQMAKENKV